MEKLNELFKNIFFEDKPVKMVFSNKRKKSLEYSKVTVRPIMVGNDICYQAEYTYEKKATHKNFGQEEAVEFCTNLIKDDFKQANIFTVSSDIQVLAAKAEKPRITKKPASLSCQNIAHNRSKNYAIPDGTPCDFLIKLGVMDKAGKVIPKHYSKFRQ